MGVNPPILFVMFATVTAAHAVPVLDPANGHTYEFIQQPMTWDAARLAASATASPGKLCHLATITSPAENDFVVNQVLPSEGEIDIWLGGERKTSCSNVPAWQFPPGRGSSDRCIELGAVARHRPRQPGLSRGP
jgi:hypothetical protein